MKIPKLHNGKVVTLVIILFIYGAATVSINFSDKLQVTRSELTRFYEAELANCTITKIKTLNYPLRGTYDLFTTSCNYDFYPIFTKLGDKEAFKIGYLISKDAKSTGIHISGDDKIYEFEIRHPDTEDDTGFGTMIALVFMLIATVLIFVLPDSKFERMAP